jgi:hypothetical protein
VLLISVLLFLKVQRANAKKLESMCSYLAELSLLDFECVRCLHLLLLQLAYLLPGSQSTQRFVLG